jgi:hypothetical protein
MLLAAVAPFRNDPQLLWSEGDTTLEDVFIHLMQRRRAGTDGH